jgi:hypothetical protein
MSLVHISGYNIQFNATNKFEIPEEPLGPLLEREISSEDVKVMVDMLEKLSENLGRTGEKYAQKEKSEV